MEAERWMTIAREELGAGIREYPGAKNNNPRILEYLHTTGSWWKTDEVPWCAAFVNWVLLTAGCLGMHCPRAASWVHYGAGLSVPCYGSVVVLRPGGTQAISGHVGFCTGWDKSSIQLLSGNYHDQITVSSFPRSRERRDGYRWPLSPSEVGGVDT